LEAAVDVDRHLELSTLLTCQLLHSLAAGVVEVMRVDTGLRAGRLGAVDTQTVAVIPFEMARAGLLNYIAVGVVVVRRRATKGVLGDVRQSVAGRVGPWRRCAQVLRPLLAPLLGGKATDAEMACPVIAVVVVLQRSEVPRRVVRVLLAVERREVRRVVLVGC